jgi:LEA14-like dessication related protein
MKQSQIIIGAAALVGGALAYRAYRLYSMAKLLKIQVMPVRATFGLSGIKLDLRVTVNNPSPTAITISTPKVKVFVQDSLIMENITAGEKVTIAPNGNTTLPVISMQAGLLQIAGSLFNALKSKPEINYTISFYVGGLLISKKDKITLSI